MTTTPPDQQSAEGGLKMAAHTPGPWFIDADEANDLNATVFAHDPEDPTVPWRVAVAIGACGYPEVQTQANARLIASAPALLEALKGLVGALSLYEVGDATFTHVETALMPARTAIRQAEGGE